MGCERALPGMSPKIALILLTFLEGTSLVRAVRVDSPRTPCHNPRQFSKGRGNMARKLYFDTEFIEYDTTLPDGKSLRVLELVSIGITDEAGKTFYAVSKDFNRAEAEKNPFVKNNVLDKLPPEEEWKSLADIRKELLDYVGPGEARFYYWFAPQDSYLLLNLLGENFLKLPANIDPMPINVAQTYRDKGHPRHMAPAKGEDAHNALADAKWVMELDRRLNGGAFVSKPKPKSYGVA